MFNTSQFNVMEFNEIFFSLISLSLSDTSVIGDWTTIRRVNETDFGD